VGDQFERLPRQAEESNETENDYMIDLIPTINLILTLLVGVGVFNLRRRINKHMATQEAQLQDALSLLGVVASGVTEIISRLEALPTDNPAIQDEIDGVKASAQSMADQINAVLNPPAPEPTPEG
jgi:CHASE3 domain sensor protein